MIDHKIEYYDNGNKKIEAYFINDKKHNDKGPANIYYSNGNISYEAYYFNNKLHNNNGPAIIGYYIDGKIEYEQYYLNGLYHNDKGPAQIWYNDKESTKKYFLYDKQIPKNDYYAFINEWDNKNDLKNAIMMYYGV